ncbi:MAG: hypothetical protein IPM42_04250 [Saprospiraceae bacterium]|nr:hypothetical protein [Saprospiraceae bacterium]
MDKKVEKDLDLIQSGQVADIYPILKPGDWVGIKAGALKQTLFGSQEAPQLVIAFGYDAPDNFIFLMPKDIEGKDPNKVLQDAYANLEAVPSEFVFSESLNNQVLTASGHDFSSEKILCQSFMLKAHKLLQAEELLVSIPRRRCMMVTSKQASEEILNKFIQLHDHAWKDGSYGNAPIINALIKIKDGKINGVFQLN